MDKSKGRAQQIRGHKRRAKVLKRRQHKNEHTRYLVNLMFKYRGNLNLKELDAPGSKYLDSYLNDNATESSNA